MSVHYKGSLTLGQLVPDLGKALDQIDSLINGVVNEAGEEQAGLLDQFNNKYNSFNKMVDDAQKQINDAQTKLDKIVSKVNEAGKFVSDLSNNLGKSGIYMYTIENALLSGIGSEVSNALAEADPTNPNDNLPSNSTVYGVLVIATDAGAYQGLTALLKPPF